MAYLLLGSPQDIYCLAVRAGLEARGHTVYSIGNLLEPPVSFRWQFDTWNTTTTMVLDGERTLVDDDLEGVLVHTLGWIDPQGWQRDDWLYMQGESQAAFLAWLWTLRCPVINRCPAHLWYQTHASLLYWSRLLWTCGLPALETLVTNVAQEARTFGTAGGAGAVFTPLTGTSGYRVVDDDAWTRLATVQEHTPVRLTRPHGEPHRACLVGDQVVWRGTPPDAPDVESRMRRLRARTGLEVIDITFATTSDGLRTIAVEPTLRLEGFLPGEQQALVTAVIGVLTGPRPDDPAVPPAMEMLYR